MKRTLLTVLLVCALVFTISICVKNGLTYTSTSSSNDVTNNEESEPGKDETQEIEAANSENKASPEEPQETIYNIGESATLKDWEISVTDMKIVKSIAASYGSFSPSEKANKYVQVFLTATNNGKQAEHFLPTVGIVDYVISKVIFGNGYEFSGTNLLGYDNDMHNEIQYILDTDNCGEIYKRY